MLRRHALTLTLLLLGGLTACGASSDGDANEEGLTATDSGTGGIDSGASDADGGPGSSDGGGGAQETDGGTGTPDAGLQAIFLQNGVAHGPLAGTAGTGHLFRLQVLSGNNHQQLEVVTSGGTGDVDLYLRSGQVVTPATATCTSSQVGNEERCFVTLPQGGAWYILVQGVTDFSGVTVKATSSTPATPLIELQNDVARTGLSSDGSSPLQFTLEVPADQERVDFQTSGGTGNASLYVKALSPPTTSSSDCASTGSGNDESCGLLAPRAGTWHGILTGTFEGLTLKGTYRPLPAPTVLSSGVSTPVRADEYFSLEVPSANQVVRFTLTGGAADFYVSQNQRPTTTAADCKFVQSQETNKVCEFFAPTAGKWFVWVRAPSSTVTLTGTAYPTQALSGTTVTNITGDAGTRSYYRLDVPAGKTELRVRLSGAGANATLKVRGKAPPSEQTPACPLQGSAALCQLSSLATGTYLVLVQGTGPFSGASLDAVLNPPGMAEAVALTDGVPVRVQGRAYEQKLLKFEMPAGVSKVDFDILSFQHEPDSVMPTGGLGYLYVQQGAVPTPSSTACQLGCTLQNPAAGTWYVLVSDSMDHDSVVRVTTSRVLPFLMNDVQEGHYNWREAKPIIRTYKLEVPTGAAELMVTLEDPTQVITAIMTVKQGDGTTVCSRNSYNPVCRIIAPVAGTWTLSLQSSVNAVLWARYVMSPGEGVPALTNGVPVRNIQKQASRNKYLFWKLEVPPGQDVLTFTRSGGGPQLSIDSMTVQKDRRPTKTDHACEGDTCIITNPEPGTWFVALQLFNNETRGLQVTGRYQQTGTVWDLQQGQPVHDLLGLAQSRQYWKIDVPAGQTSLTFTDNPAYATKSVRYGALPEGTASEECEPSCTITNPSAGSWYVLLQGHYFYDFSETRLSAYYSTTPDDGVPLLTDKVEVYLRASKETAFDRTYKIHAPPGAKGLRVTLRRPVETSASNYTTLYVRKGAAPTGSLYDCYYDAPSWNYGTCEVAGGEGMYYVRVVRQVPNQEIAVDMLPQVP